MGGHAQHTTERERQVGAVQRVEVEILHAFFRQLAAQLREATRNEHWTLDWGHFNTLGQQAQAALSAGDYSTAVRNYALSISFMMSEIRRQSGKKDQRDSSVL